MTIFRLKVAVTTIENTEVISEGFFFVVPGLIGSWGGVTVYCLFLGIQTQLYKIRFLGLFQNPPFQKVFIMESYKIKIIERAWMMLRKM